VEQGKKLESAKLNQARYINVDFTDRLSTNNQSNVNIDNPDTSYFNIDNAKKQTTYIRDINVTLKESIKFLQKEFINIQTPDNKLVLVDQSKIDSYRRKTNDVEGENKLLGQKKNSRYEQSSQTKKINEPRTYTAKIEEVNQRV
jgi:hypothetical protein